jgi:hypothetical protein
MSDHERVVPAWVTDGWYSNNSAAQQLAIARYFLPVALPAEVTIARLDAELRQRHLRGECTRPCYWCGEGLHPEMQTLLSLLPAARHGPDTCTACRTRSYGRR